MDLFTNTSVPSLQIALSGLSERQAGIGENLANISVPGYKAQHVSFEQNLQAAIEQKRTKSSPLVTTHQEHISLGATAVDDVEIETVTDTQTEIHSGGNNVDIDAEMVDLARTGLQYRALTQIARRQMDGLRSVIRGGS